MIAEFFLMFHRDKPIDWLLDHILWVKVCNPEKDDVSQLYQESRNAKYRFICVLGKSQTTSLFFLHTLLFVTALQIRKNTLLLRIFVKMEHKSLNKSVVK